MNISTENAWLKASGQLRLYVLGLKAASPMAGISEPKCEERKSPPTIGLCHKRHNTKTSPDYYRGPEATGLIWRQAFMRRLCLFSCSFLLSILPYDKDKRSWH